MSGLMIINSSNKSVTGVGYGQYNDGKPGLDLPLTYYSTAQNGDSRIIGWMGIIGGYLAVFDEDNPTTTDTGNPATAKSFSMSVSGFTLFTRDNSGAYIEVGSGSIPQFSHIYQQGDSIRSYGGTQYELSIHASFFGGFIERLDGIVYNGGSLEDTISFSIFEQATTLIGGAGRDYLIGSKHHANRLFGGEGKDTLYGNGTLDLVEGGDGDDYITDADNNSDIYNSVAYDADTLKGGNGNDTVLASGGNDSLEGNDGNDYLQSQQGNNRLDGGTGADTMRGGLGHDIYVVDNVGDVVVELANEGTDRVLASISYTLGDNVENLGLATSASINGTGNALANLITGNAGANILDGREGIDTLTGGTGADTFAFGTALAPGNVDRITDFSVVDDTIRLDGSVFKGLVDGPLAAASFAEVGAGTPSASVRILYDRSTGALFYDADGGGTASSPVQFAILDNKAALTAADFVVGLKSGSGGGGTDPSGLNVVAGATDGNDSLVGTSNGDLLNGGLGADTLKGLAGNDTYVVDNAGDVVVELANEGTDTVRTSLATYTLGADVENLTYTGSAGFTGTGNAAANLITGGGSIDRLDGAAGADTMVGGLGSDTYVVDVAGDVVVEKVGEGTDRVLASISYTLGDNVENLGLGTSASLDGTGNALTNLIVGNKGNNVLDGRGGADTLTGGLGQDTFVLRASETAGDTITDFVRGTDKLAFYGFGTDAVLSHSAGGDLYTVTSGDGLTSGSFRLTGVGDLDVSMGAGNTDARFFA